MTEPIGLNDGGIRMCLRRLAPLVVSVWLVALGVPAVAGAAAKPPSITSAFVPNLIAVAGTTSLSYTITNPNASGTLNGVSFTDTLPNGVVVDNPNGESGSCGSSSVITANAGANTISLIGGSVKAGTNCTFSVNVTSNTPAIYRNSTGTVSSTNDGNGNSDTESLTVAGPPTLAVQSPRNNATYNFGQRVILRFSCQEAANGPGLSECAANLDQDTDNLSSGTRLLTSIAGPHTLTVWAISSDGATVSDTINYTVRPDNHFSVLRVKAGPSGAVSYKLKLPGPGRVSIKELAAGSVVGQTTVRIGQPGKVTVTVQAAKTPSSSGIAKITFRPKGGVARTITVHGISL